MTRGTAKENWSQYGQPISVDPLIDLRLLCCCVQRGGWLAFWLKCDSARDSVRLQSPFMLSLVHTGSSSSLSSIFNHQSSSIIVIITILIAIAIATEDCWQEQFTLEAQLLLLVKYLRALTTLCNFSVYQYCVEGVVNVSVEAQLLLLLLHNAL